MTTQRRTTTTVTIAHRGDPSELDASLRYLEEATRRGPDARNYVAWRRARAILLAALGRDADLPDGLGVARSVREPSAASPLADEPCGCDASEGASP
jgi:hypothetical protein